MSKKTLKSPTLVLPLSFLLLSLSFSFITFLKIQQLSANTSMQAEASVLAAESGVTFHAMRVYQSFVSKKDGSFSVPATINLASDPIPAGGVVLVGVTSVGSDQVSVTDSQGNTYQLKQSVAVVNGAKTFLFTSKLINSLQSGDTITVSQASGKSLAFTTMGFSGVGDVAEVATNTGISSTITSASVTANAGDVVLSIGGLNQKASGVGITYSPNVTYQSIAGTDSGNNNSYVAMDAFVASAAGPQSIQNPLTNPKNRQPLSLNWGSVIVTLRYEVY